MRKKPTSNTSTAGSVNLMYATSILKCERRNVQHSKRGTQITMFKIIIWYLIDISNRNSYSYVSTQFSLQFCFIILIQNCTVETRIKEPTFLGNSLLKDLLVCLYNPYIRHGGSASLAKTWKDCIFITAVFSPIDYSAMLSVVFPPIIFFTF